MDQSIEDPLVFPYENQVGGHHCIISYQGHLLKPYNEREALMYTLIPYKFPSLIPFLTGYYGVIELLEIASIVMAPPTSIALGILQAADFNRGPKKEHQKIFPTGVPEQRGKEEWLERLFQKRFNAGITSKRF